MQEAFEDYLKAATAFREVFDKEEDAFLDRVAVSVAKQLRFVADAAHSARRRAGQPSEIMNRAGEELRRMLRAAAGGDKVRAWILAFP